MKLSKTTESKHWNSKIFGKHVPGASGITELKVKDQPLASEAVYNPKFLYPDPEFMENVEKRVKDELAKKENKE